MMKKFFTPIFGILFISLFSYFFGGEYFDFYKKNNQLHTHNQHVKSQGSDFQLSDIRTLENITLHHTPDGDLLNTILKKIDTAQERIFVEVYILTEKKIQEHLKTAKQKGLDIKVILEKNPYKAGNINNKTYNFLIKNQIDVVWSNPKNYSLNHSKVILIDDEAIISTGNLSHSTFKYNRDFFIFTHDKKIVSTLEKVFQADFNGVKQSNYDSNLVLSPNYSREKLSTLFNNAKQDIKLYFQYFKDDAMEQLLIKKASEGVKISAIISESSWKRDADKINMLQKNGIEINPLETEKMHAKMILIDHTYLYIGSVNFSNYSFDFNREVGILTKNKSIISQILHTFAQDKNK